MTLTSEGLAHRIIGTANGTFFDSGSPDLNESGKETLIALAKELGGVPNRSPLRGTLIRNPWSVVAESTETGSFLRIAPTLPAP